VLSSKAALYRELGDFGDYIIGDFEDSDLCLRAILAGRRNRVAFDIELYHLERQSQNRGVVMFGAPTSLSTTAGCTIAAGRS